MCLILILIFSLFTVAHKCTRPLHLAQLVSTQITNIGLLTLFLHHWCVSTPPPPPFQMEKISDTVFNQVAQVKEREG